MKAWRIDRLGGQLHLNEISIPYARPGSVLVRIEAQSLMSYLKDYVEGKLPAYRAPEGDFVPGGNAIGVIETVGADVWHLEPGQRVVISSHLIAQENVPDPGQILIGVTSPGGVSDAMQKSWRDGTLAEYALFPASTITPLEGFEDFDLAQLATITRCIVPFGGLIRGRLKAGETVIVNGATGAYGGAAILVAIAMGAARVVAAGRDKEVLNAVAKAASPRVVPVPLTGDVAKDASALRAAAGGGAHLAFDMVGGAKDPNSTLSALVSLYRYGRLVLMGSSTAPVPINYMLMMSNSLEIIGNFMYPRDAYLALLALLRSGQLNLSAIVPKVFSLDDLPQAMEYAAKARSLECVIIVPKKRGGGTT